MEDKNIKMEDKKKRCSFEGCKKKLKLFHLVVSVEVNFVKHIVILHHTIALVCKIKKIPVKNLLKIIIQLLLTANL